jgi:hypothetical protein
VVRLTFLALAAGVTVGALSLAAQWWWPDSHAAPTQANATEPQATGTGCVFVNHVRRGPGHPYRQEAGEKCRYELEPRTAY